METYGEIIDAFEKALTLERELGVREVECDLAPTSPTSPPPNKPPAPQPPRLAVPNPSVPQPVPRNVPAPQPVPQSVAKPESRKLGQQDSATAVATDFAFIVQQHPVGAAKEMFEKMVGAMGYTLDRVQVVDCAVAAHRRPQAKVYIVLGSQAFRQFAPDKRAALGLWTDLDGVPTVVTYSPTRILSYFGSDPAGLRQAKVQIWNDLKAALARLPRN